MECEAAAFAALGHPSRLAVFRLLARRAPGDAPAGEIADALGVARNVMSAYLAVLSRAGLIHGARCGKQIRYRIDLVRAGALIDYLALDCCRGRPELCAPLSAAALRRPRRGDVGADAPRPLAALFVCTGNSARSIFAEAILNREGQGRLRAFSAGADPCAALNPFAVDALETLGHDARGLRPKSVATFRGPDAPPLDFVFTVCDRAANAEHPPWPGQPMTAHWGVPDPAEATGAEADKRRAFLRAYRMLEHRLAAFAALPFEALDAVSLQREIDRIGAMDSATAAG